MSKVQSQVTLALLLAATMLELAVAQPSFPGLGVPVEVQQCLLAVTSVEGCAQAFFNALLGGQFKNVGPDCCKAILAIEDNCWRSVFPFNPFFPALKRFCSGLGAVPPSARH